MSGMPQVTNIDNRPWFKKPIGIAGIVGGAVLVVGIGAASGGGGDDDTKDTSASPTQAESSNKGDDKGDGKQASETPAPVAKWETVATLSGNTNKSGPDFHLEGCDARLKYDIDGSSSSIVAIYVMESGTQLMEDGGFPVASPTESGAGETTLRNDEGDYYVEVMAANAGWSVKVQEKC